MKNLKLICLITILAVAFVSVGAVNAAGEGTVTGSLSKYSVHAGEALTVTFTVHNNAAFDMQLLDAGMHGDWMGQDNEGNDNFQGPTFSSSPVTVAAGDSYSGTFIINIPAGTAIGTYSFYIGADTKDASNNYYSFDSSEQSLQIVAVGATVSPSQSTGPTQNGGDSGLSSADILFYVAIVAIAAMVVLALMVLLTLRKRSRARSQAPFNVPPANPPEPKPKPEPEPEMAPPAPKEKPESGEEFDI